MVIRRRTGDRRSRPRFEIVGDLPGTFEAQPLAGDDTTRDSSAPTAINVLDIGLGGVLMAAEALPGQGDYGVLRLLLSTGPFESRVEIRHLTPSEGPKQRERAGAAFRQMSEDSRRMLEQFLLTAS